MTARLTWPLVSYIPAWAASVYHGPKCAIAECVGGTLHQHPQYSETASTLMVSIPFLCRCRLQAERGLTRTKHAMRADAFTAWQDTRQRGLLAMKKMDTAFTRWNTYLLAWSMATMHRESRRKALIRHRGAWLVHKREQCDVGDALTSWHGNVVGLRALRKIDGSISSKHARLAKRGAFALWWEGADERRCLRAAGQRVADKHERLLERGAWAGWAMVTLSDKACLVACERALAKRDRWAAMDAIDTWRGEIARAQHLLDIYNRVRFVWGLGLLVGGGEVVRAEHSTPLPTPPPPPSLLYHFAFPISRMAKSTSSTARKAGRARTPCI